jgi:hypothetical protein
MVSDTPAMRSGTVQRLVPLEYVLVCRKWKIVPGPGSLAWNVYHLIWETRRYAS